MNFNTKPKCIYIKNIYMQPSKNHKLNNSTNLLSKNNKNNSDYNANNRGLNYIQKETNKTSIKSFYQNIYPKKEKYLIKGNPNYLSSKIINSKIASKYGQKHISTGKNYGPTISGRKIINKNYEIHNPFKERSNSENSLNCFNRTYSFFNKKEDNISNVKAKPGNIINITKKDNDKINISCTNINKKYNYRNYINNDKNYNSSKNSNKSNINLKENKKYFYQEPNYKNSFKQDTNEDNSIIYSTLQKDYNNIMSPIINDNTTNNNINISSITTPINDQDDLNDIMNNRKNKRIKKYFISDKKKKMRSRQNNKEINNPLWKSTAIKDEIENRKNNNYYYNNNNNDFDSKILEKVQNFPSIQVNDKSTAYKKLNFYHLKENNNSDNNNSNNNNNFENMLDTSNYFDSTPLLDSYCKELQSNEINIIKKNELFEQSAIIIQSIFRGYLAKSKFETLLYNYKDYNRANEILEELFNTYFKKDIINEKQFFMNYLKEIINKTKLGNKDNINYKSCKIFKLYNMPLSLETEVPMARNRYIDLFLHKEIGERFNILNENINREKEIEKKHKEEIDEINDKMNKLIEENNKLKDLNQKNKLKENKYKEISIENKKKDNIINIITNDNQNLAKKLKIIKEKYNKLEIKNEINVIINLNDNNRANKNILSNELYMDYRNIFLLYLFNKKNYNRKDILRKYFHRYKDAIISINNNNKLNNSLRKQKLKNIITNSKNKGNKIVYDSLVKIYFNNLLKDKDIQNINNTKKEKILKLFQIKDKVNKFLLKSYFTKFYNNGIISQLIEEKNEMRKKEEKEKINRYKKIIISIENHKNKYNNLKLQNCFNKWYLMSKMLTMKAITDEKKRKKRQKQRTKKKIEKNKSANKYLSNSSNKNMSIEKKYINIFTKEKEKEKEKDIVNYLEHSLTTEISGGEINIDSKTDKIAKATEKLSDLFLKASLYYKIDNKKQNINLNKVNINQNCEKNNNNMNRENMNSNDNDNDEDSGESSFGI